MPPIADCAYSPRVYEGVAQVNSEDWTKVVLPGDLAMDPRLIGVSARTLAGQFKFWTVLIYNDQQTIAACAALCLFRIDGLASAPGLLRRWGAAVCRFWPGFMKFGVLFCGLPIPPAQSSLRFAPGADRAAIVRVLDGVMRQLARREGALLRVFKEFNQEQNAQLGVLSELGYIRGDIPPMHHFTARFSDFGAYQNALKARYRSQIKRSIKKFEQAGFTARRVHEPSEVLRAYTDELQQLYLQVWRHSKYRLEQLPAEFFRELARAFPDAATLTLLERNGQVAAFTFSLAAGGVYHNMYSGMDYGLNGEGDLYFNLFYNDLDGAFRSGAPDIELGQTSDDFKARLGSAAHEMYFYTRACNPLVHRMLRMLSGRVFPAVPRVEPHHVFNEGPPSAPSRTRHTVTLPAS